MALPAIKISDDFGTINLADKGREYSELLDKGYTSEQINAALQKQVDPMFLANMDGLQGWVAAAQSASPEQKAEQIVGRQVGADAAAYSGLPNAQPAKAMDLRTLVEATTGHALDYSQPGEQEVVNRAIAALYGNIGANVDGRNWEAIMAAPDPLKAAEAGLKTMYSDKTYLAANTDSLLTKGYLPEQADLTYQQMAGRVGSKYDSNWSKGTKFEGKYDTVNYLKNASALKGNQLASYEDTLWTQWGGNPVKNRGVVDADATSNTSVTTPTAFAPAPGKLTGAATVTPGAVTTVPAAAVTAGSVGTPAATSTAQTAPVQLNASVASGGTGLLTGANTLTSGGNSASTGNNTSSTGGTGLLTGANTLTPGTFNIGNTSTGNVNTGGLITGAQQQMFTQNAQVGLPTGVIPKIGAMGNNTGGASITPYNPYKFTGASTATGSSQNWYNSKTGQRYTAPAGTWTPPSADWAKY